METDLRHSHRSKRIIKKQTMTSEGEIKTSKNPSEKSKTNSSDDVNLSSDFQNDIKKVLCVKCLIHQNTVHL